MGYGIHTKKILGFAPLIDENKGFSPSPVALKLATKKRQTMTIAFMPMHTKVEI